MSVVLAVGDIMLGDSATTVGFGVHTRYPGRSLKGAFADVTTLLSDADVCIGNLECLLTERGIGRTRLARDQMRGDPAYATVLREVGFQALGVANNHATQHGRDAFDETIAHLTAAGIACFGLRGQNGWCSEPVILPLSDGGSLGILGYCWRPRQYSQTEPPFAEGSPAEVLADIARLRPTVSMLVVSLHWGEEFLAEPSASEVTFAEDAIAAGADAIVGHHPHVRRPLMRVRGKVVAFSLGNMLSDMLWMEELRRGTILRLSADEHGVVPEVADVRTDDDYVVRLGSGWRPVNLAGLRGLPEWEYRSRVAETVRAQRWAAYRYSATNAWRFPLRVGFELAATTLMNKLGPLLSRRHG